MNDRINNFDFIEDKPALIDPKIFKKHTKLKQSASQIITLTKNFPILIVPEGDKHWYCFQVLIKFAALLLHLLLLTTQQLTLV